MKHHKNLFWPDGHTILLLLNALVGIVTYPTTKNKKNHKNRGDGTVTIIAEVSSVAFSVLSLLSSKWDMLYHTTKVEGKKAKSLLGQDKKGYAYWWKFILCIVVLLTPHVNALSWVMDWNVLQCFPVCDKGEQHEVRQTM